MTAFPLARESLSARYAIAAVAAWIVTVSFGLRIANMDPTALVNAFAALTTALGIAIATVIGAYLHLRKWNMDSDEEARLERVKNDRMRKNIVRRGFYEAVRCKLLTRTASPDGRTVWLVAEQARIAYAPIMLALRETATRLAKNGVPPADVELVMAIEDRWDDWLLDNVCAPLGVNDYGCLAIASALARETDSLRASLASSPAHPNELGKPA